jgi:hypothetical protein
MRADLDMHSRAIAERIGQDFPQWLVMWGAYSGWLCGAPIAARIGHIPCSRHPGEPSCIPLTPVSWPGRCARYRLVGRVSDLDSVTRTEARVCLVGSGNAASFGVLAHHVVGLPAGDVHEVVRGPACF